MGPCWSLGSLKVFGSLGSLGSVGVLGGPWRSLEVLGAWGPWGDFVFPPGDFVSLFSLRFPLFFRFGAPRLGAFICDFNLRFLLNSPKKAPSEFKD